jgi:hypothetical protein
MVPKGPFQETSQSGMSEPYIPCQIQAQGLHYVEKFHDLGALSKGKKIEGDCHTTKFQMNKNLLIDLEENIKLMRQNVIPKLLN